MIKVILYIFTLIIVIWGEAFMVIAASFSGNGEFYIPVVIIGCIMLPVLIFIQMYHLMTPKKRKLLWISFFFFLLVSCSVYEIFKAYNRSLLRKNDDVYSPYENKNVVSLGKTITLSCFQDDNFVFY